MLQLQIKDCRKNLPAYLHNVLIRRFLGYKGHLILHGPYCLNPNVVAPIFGKYKLAVAISLNTLNKYMQSEKMRRLTKAIETRLVVAFSYNNLENHIVEPFTLGVHKDTGQYVLRCYGNLPLAHTENPDSWKLFELNKIDKLQVMPIVAKTERNGYEALDKEMSEIISFTVSNRRVK